jgi:hypothetical protein
MMSARCQPRFRDPTGAEAVARPRRRSLRFVPTRLLRSADAIRRLSEASLDLRRARQGQRPSWHEQHPARTSLRGRSHGSTDLLDPTSPPYRRRVRPRPRVGSPARSRRQVARSGVGRVEQIGGYGVGSVRPGIPLVAAANRWAAVVQADDQQDNAERYDDHSDRHEFKTDARPTPDEDRRGYSQHERSDPRSNAAIEPWRIHDHLSTARLAKVMPGCNDLPASADLARPRTRGSNATLREDTFKCETSRGCHI